MGGITLTYIIYFISYFIIYSNQDSLSSVSLTSSNIQYDNGVKQFQAAASCSDYKIKCVNTTSDKSKVLSYFKTDSFPDVQIMKGKQESILSKIIFILLYSYF